MNLLQSFVELPDTVKVGIAGVITWAVAWLITQLILLFPWLQNILDGFQTQIAMAISAALIGLIQNAVPDAYGNVAVLSIQLVLALLALFGIGETLRQRGVKGFRLFKKSVG